MGLYEGEVASWIYKPLAMETHSKTRKILMLPWLAYGHISPFLELAKRLSHFNFHIYLCSSPANLHSVRSKLPENYSSSVQLVELDLPSSPELPPQMHTTNGLPLHLIPTLMNAFAMAAPQFSTVLQKLNPDLLICDIYNPRTIQLAFSLNIPVTSFFVVGAGLMSLGIHSMQNRNAGFPFHEFDLKDHWSSKNYANASKDSSDASGHNGFLQWVNNQELSSNIVLINSFTEIDGKYMDYISELLNKKVVPIGPLVQEVHSSDEKSDVLDWLDKKPQKSTVYVSFGSEYYLSKEDREELAHGLEWSGVNFIWVLRFPKGEGMAIEEALPDGFVQRIGERGVVVDGWAPQMRILAHESVGGFVCHCGWNSVMEAVVCGVPIIALPMQLDQPYHARVTVAAGVGVEAERDGEGGVLREGVAKAIKEVVVEEKCEGLRRKVREMSGILKRREGESIKGLVAELDQLCEARKAS